MDNNIKSAFEELYREDGLTVMGRGLGINYLYAKFCQLYSTVRSNQEVSRKLVFCINAGGMLFRLVTSSKVHTRKQDHISLIFRL